jgi:hypothetical protein
MSKLLDAVIAAHGGLERWSAVRSIDVTFNFSGAGAFCAAADGWNRDKLEVLRPGRRICRPAGHAQVCPRLCP